MLHGDRHVVPLGLHEVPPRHAGRGEADGVQRAVDRCPTRLASALAHRGAVLGIGDVELEHSASASELAGGARR